MHKGVPAFSWQNLAYRHILLCDHASPTLETAEQKEQRWKLSLVAHPHVMSRCEPAGVMGAFWESIAKGLGLANISLSNISLWASGCGLDNTGRVCLWYSECGLQFTSVGLWDSESSGLQLRF